MNHRRLIFTISCGLAATTFAYGPSDPDKILADALQASKDLKSIQYSVVVKQNSAEIKADIVMAQANVSHSGYAPGKYWVKGSSSDGVKFEFAYDGNALRIRNADDTVRVLESPSPYQVGQLTPPEAISILVPVPAGDFGKLSEQRAKLRYVRQATIGKWTCDVIEIQRTVSHPAIGETTIESDWAFDRKSHLPVQRETSFGTTTVTSMQLNPTVNESVFKLEGKEIKANPQGPETDKLLTVGSIAPNFSLKAPDGKLMSLKDFKGKVVVLDFWGTWCAPCRKTMPILQELHKTYAKKGLAVVGISVADKEGNPVAFMKRMGLNYQLLMSGDSVAKAYKAALLPTIYIIGKDGKIVFRQAGVGENDKAVLTKAVEKQLAVSKT